MLQLWTSFPFQNEIERRGERVEKRSHLFTFRHLFFSLYEVCNWLKWRSSSNCLDERINSFPLLYLYFPSTWNNQMIPTVVVLVWLCSTVQLLGRRRREMKRGKEWRNSWRQLLQLIRHEIRKNSTFHYRHCIYFVTSFNPTLFPSCLPLHDWGHKRPQEVPRWLNWSLSKGRGKGVKERERFENMLGREREIEGAKKKSIEARKLKLILGSMMLQIKSMSEWVPSKHFLRLLSFSTIALCHLPWFRFIFTFPSASHFPPAWTRYDNDAS